MGIPSCQSKRIHYVQMNWNLQGHMVARNAGQGTFCISVHALLKGHSIFTVSYRVSVKVSVLPSTCDGFPPPPWHNLQLCLLHFPCLCCTDSSQLKPGGQRKYFSKYRLQGWSPRGKLTQAIPLQQEKQTLALASGSSRGCMRMLVLVSR